MANRRVLPIPPRALLVGLLVVATVGFVVGVIVERSKGDAHEEPSAAASEPGAAADMGGEQAGEAGRRAR